MDMILANGMFVTAYVDIPCCHCYLLPLGKAVDT